MEKTRKQLTEKNAEYISTKAAQNREEIERVKESAKKDIDRANANVIAKEEECEKLECEIVELKRDAKLRQTAYEAQLENLHKQSHVTSVKAKTTTTVAQINMARTISSQRHLFYRRGAL